MLNISQVVDAGKNSLSLLCSETAKREKYLDGKKCKNNGTISCL